MVEKQPSEPLTQQATDAIRLPGHPAVPPQQQRKRLHNVVIASVLLMVIIGGLLLAFVLLAGRQADAPDSRNQATDETEKQILGSDPSTIRMLATGDFIAHDAINAEAGAGGSYNYAPMLEPFQPYFARSDINFCNQATLAGGDKFGISGYPVFNAPFEWIRDMRGAGCNLINVGTNHTNDKGQGPITAQLQEWDKQEGVLAVAGANRSSEEQARVRYFTVKGVKFAFLSYSTYSNLPNPNPYSLNRFTDEIVVPQMTEARQQADLIIVSMRWGTEYSETVNAAQKQQAKKLADLGADIILGHGTHTLQAVDHLISTLPDGVEHNALVWYGLGNFLNSQLETTGLTGCVAQFDIDAATKKVTGTSCLPFYQHYEWTAEQKAREDLLARTNFRIMPLFEAQDYLAKSQLNTTVEAQMERIRSLVNQLTEVSVQNARDL